MAYGAPGIHIRPVFEKSDNRIFDKNKEVHFGFELNNRLGNPVEVKFIWQVVTDQKKPISKSAPSTIEIPVDEKRVVSHAAKIPGPGFYKGTITCSWKGGKVNQTVQVGCAPEKLLPPLTSEPDFEKFWKESLGQLREIDPQYQLIHQQ